MKIIEEEESNTSLGNRFERGLGSILTDKSLREGGSHIGHTVRCYVVLSEDVINIIEVGHEELGLPI